MSSRRAFLSGWPALWSFVTCLAIAAMLAISCGGDGDGDSASPGTGVTSSLPASMSGACTPAGSAIAGITRNNQRSFAAYPPTVIDQAKKYTAVVHTNKGDITIELAPAEAPLAVNNFVFLACTGYYDGVTFHRYEADFVIQGGDPRGDGTGGPGYVFKTETNARRHDSAGVLAMARTNQLDTNGSQFYITLAAAPGIDPPAGGPYTIFGKVTAGLDVVKSLRRGDKINAVDVAES